MTSSKQLQSLDITEVILLASVAVLAIAGFLWILFPKARPGIAAAVIASPIPPIP
jgi:hypothetical protein